MISGAKTQRRADSVACQIAIGKGLSQTDRKARQYMGVFFKDDVL
jgi:hypothetical protein